MRRELRFALYSSFVRRAGDRNALVQKVGNFLAESRRGSFWLTLRALCTIITAFEYSENRRGNVKEPGTRWPTEHGALFKRHKPYVRA